MKKILFFIPLLLNLWGCDTFEIKVREEVESYHNKYYKNWKEENKNEFSMFVDKEIGRANDSINNIAKLVISKADSDLKDKLIHIENIINQKVEGTKIELDKQIKEHNTTISNLEEKISHLEYIAYGGGTIASIAFILSLIAFIRTLKLSKYASKNYVDDMSNQLKDQWQLSKTELLAECQKMYHYSPKNYPNYQGSSSDISIDELKKSNQFRSLIKSLFEDFMPNTKVIGDMSSLNKGKQPSLDNKVLDNNNNYQFFAQRSKTIILSEITELFDKGYSIYQLSMNNINSDTADITICLNQEGVKQRVLKNGVEFLEPICKVTNLSSDPKEVTITSIGKAQRVGDDWHVIKPIEVEFQ